MGIEQKVAVITGASQGIGAALVKAYRDRNYRVVATARSVKPLGDADVLVVHGDIADRTTAVRAISEGLARFGRIDTLVNDAGIFIAKPFTQYTDADYAAMLSVNLTGFFNITQLAVAEMEKQGSGHVVQITTSLIDNAIVGVPSVLASLTKGGLNAATKSLAIEYAKRGMRVNAVALGIIKTPMHPVETHAQLAALHPCRLASHPELRWRVAEKLALDWSPEQISGWLKRAFPADEGLRVSHETICRSVFVQARGVLKKELIGHLRAGRRTRYPKGGTTPSRLPGQIVDAISIRERPAESEDRAVPGHWEGDLLSGANNSHMATLVERHSRFAMLVKVRGKDTTSVGSALSKQVRQLPLQLRRSLTWDRGKEMADHKRFTIATDVQVYFCDPRSPWQRGSNENTNGLLRQYFPKGMDLSGYSQSDLNKIALRLNQRPRKTLGFETPADKLRAVSQ